MATVTQAVISTSVLPDANVGMKFTDTLDIDQEAHRLYMGDNWSAGLDIFDITTAEPRFLRTIRMRGLLYGIAVAKNVQKVFVGLNAGMVAAVDIDPESNKVDTVIARVDVGGRGHADLLDYDPLHRKLYVANRNDGFMTAIDAVTNSVVKRIEGLGGGLEQPRFNPADGMVYLCGNSDNVLYQIDPVRDELVNTFDIGDPCHPNGLAINPETGEALLACGNRERPHTVIWDLKRQQAAMVTDECGCGDGAIYSAAADRFFFAASGFISGPLMGIFGGRPARLLTNVPTRQGASWVAYDETNRIVYAPTIQNGKPALLGFSLPPEGGAT
ncbi:MAG: YncE family protein [Chloroflexota bacterium]